MIGMGFGSRDSGFGKAGSTKLTVNLQPVRALLQPNPGSQQPKGWSSRLSTVERLVTPNPGSARSYP